MTRKTLNNVVGLNSFSELTEEEMLLVEGGIDPWKVVQGISFVYGAGYAIGNLFGKLF